jgi:hypothetical protein
MDSSFAPGAEGITSRTLAMDVDEDIMEGIGIQI